LRARRAASRAGIAFTALSNGFAACDAPVALQEICNRLGPGTIHVFAQRWLHALPPSPWLPPRSAGTGRHRAQPAIGGTGGSARALGSRGGGVRPGGPAIGEHVRRRTAVLAGHQPRRDGDHVLGRHPGDPLSAAGTRIKALRSHLSAADLAKLMANGARPAGAPPVPPARPGPAVEVDRTVNRNGMVGLGGRTVLAAEILAGRRVGIRVEENTLMFFDPATRQLLRIQPSPFTPQQAQTLQGARPAGPPPQPSTAPVTVQRHASATGVIVVAGQKIALGRTHAGQAVTVYPCGDGQ
jgi:hypothetical protein